MEVIECLPPSFSFFLPPSPPCLPPSLFPPSLLLSLPPSLSPPPSLPPPSRHTNGSVIVRSSQPLVGVLGWRNTEDEGLLLAISQACLPAHPSPSPPPPTYSELPYSNGGPPAQLMEERGDRGESLANGNAHVTGTGKCLEDCTHERPVATCLHVSCHFIAHF